MEVDEECENHNNVSLQTAVFTNPPTNDPPQLQPHYCNHVAVSVQEPIVVSVSWLNKIKCWFLKKLLFVLCRVCALQRWSTKII